MNFFILILPLLIIKHSSGDVIVNTIQEKLWSNIERQLEELTKKQELQKTKINGLKSLLRREGINFTQNSMLNDEDDNDPYAYAIVSNIKYDFELLKSYYTQVKTVDVKKNIVLQAPNRNLSDTSSFGYLLPYLPKEHCTSGSVYKFVPVTGTEFRFKIRSPANGFVALAYRPFEMLPMYDIIIGGYGNKKSVIRKDRSVELTKIAHGNLLNECEFMGFWIRWDDGVIRVGYETDVEPFMQYNATDLYKVNYIGLMTADKIGNWIIN